MNEVQKHDVSIPMAQASLVGSLIAIPVGVLQISSFLAIYGTPGSEPRLNLPLLIVLILLGIPVHELIHGLSWAFFGKKPFSAIKFGFMWKSVTPYAHIKEPLEVTAYRLGTFMPGLLLGIIPFVAALLTGIGDLLWFSLMHATAASGDWLVLWIIRQVKPGSLVEDHPSRTGCYVLEDI